MKINKNRMIRVDKDTLNRLKMFKRQMSAIENDEIYIGDVIRRVMKGTDILERLKVGSVERRLKKK